MSVGRLCWTWSQTCSEGTSAGTGQILCQSGSYCMPHSRKYMLVAKNGQPGVVQIPKRVPLQRAKSMSASASLAAQTRECHLRSLKQPS
jgi:hypothetical protein